MNQFTDRLNDLGVLKVTDGTTTGTIDLLNDFNFAGWRPQVLKLKPGATVLDSPFSMGYQLVNAQKGDVEDLFLLYPKGESGNLLIEEVQNLRRLLEKGRDYWLSDWQSEPVWLIARGINESNTRYGLITNYRSPEDGDPYQSPFSTEGIFEDWNLSITHRPWGELPPVTSECVEIGAQGPWCACTPLRFNTTVSDRVVVTDQAAIQNMTQSLHVFDCWFYFNNHQEFGVTDNIIWSKNTLEINLVELAGGWAVRAFQQRSAPPNQEKITKPGHFQLNTWHHLAVFWSGAATPPAIFIDWVEAPIYSKTTGGGVAITDVGSDLYIGNESGLANYFDGLLVQARIQTLGSPLPVTERCTLPGTIVNVVGGWIYEGSGAVADNWEGTAALDGLRGNTAWEYNDTDHFYGREMGDCGERESFFSFRSNMAQITDVYTYDASGPTWGLNLQTQAAPKELFPDPVNVGDMLYLGSNTDRLNTGMFTSAVFDVLTPRSPLITAWVFEYWNGSWTDFTTAVQDGTNQGGQTDAGGSYTGIPFDTAGVNAWSWDAPSDWATTTVNGVVGYWIRLRVTTTPFALSPPTQDEREIYTVTWPHIDIDEESVNGDIASPAYLQIEGVSSDQSETFGVDGPTRYIMSLRSNQRGDIFSPYINYTDQQVRIPIAVTGGIATFQDDEEAPTGRSVVFAYTSGGWQDGPQVLFENENAQQYFGKFRVYLVADHSTVIGGIRYRLKVKAGTQSYLYTDPVSRITAGIREIIDLGSITLPAAKGISHDEQIAGLEITAQAEVANGDSVTYYFLVLMPADEYILDTGVHATAQGRIRDDHPFYIDSISYPKHLIRTWQMEKSFYDINQFDFAWQNDSVGEFFLQANNDQRLYFFGGVATADSWEWIMPIQAVRLYKNARYQSMRGSR